MRKSLLTVLTACLFLITALNGCRKTDKTVWNGQVDTQADKGLSVVGRNIKFNPNKLINDGQPIQINFWWLADSDGSVQKLIDDYQRIHPNVRIQLIENGWDSIWTKLPLALQKKEKGPTLFFVHNSYESLLLPYMAPYDIPLDELLADYPTSATHIINGNVYYTDYGLMTGVVYYNKDYWREAGLTDADIPRTWDELAAVAKKLTVRDENGKLLRAGFNWNADGSFILLDLFYIRNQNIFNREGTLAMIDSPACSANIQMLIDLYDVHQVGDKNFGPDCVQSFGQGQSAMTYRWGNFCGDLMVNYPDIEYGVFETPTIDGTVPYAYNRYNGEATIGINAGATPEQMEVAQDFLRFYLTNEEYMKQSCLRMSVYPGYTVLQDDPEMLASPVVKVMSRNIDRYIWPGAMPATLENNLRIAVEDIVYNGRSIEKVLAETEATINIDLENTGFVAAENKYAYYVPAHE